MIKTFKANLDDLPKMLDYIKHEASSVKFKEFEVSKIVLAAEEALVNVISYGFPNKPPGTITINCESDIQKGLDITISDDGIEFNPLGNTDSLHSIPFHSVDHRKIGGIGILVILRIMDNVTYRRDEGFNVLILEKYL